MADDDVNPFGDLPFDGNPFGAMPFLNEMMKSLTSQGPLNWDVAKQVAMMTVGSKSVNVDPAARIAFEQLAPLAYRQVADFLASLSIGSEPSIDYVTPAQWCHWTLDSYRPIFENLAGALSQQSNGSAGIDDTSDAMVTMLHGLMGAMAPMMLGMTVGSMIGMLATRSFGPYDILLPRESAAPIRMVPDNIDEFAREWELPESEVRMWVLIHEITAHIVLAVPHIRTALLESVDCYVSAFSPSPEAVLEGLSDSDFDVSNPMGAIQRTFSDPSVLLGAVVSPEQEAQRPQLDALLATVVGLIDWAVDSVNQRVLGGAPAVTEAVRRRRVESTTADKFVEHLLGIHHTLKTVDRGRQFIAGVVERAGTDAVLQVLTRADGLPTPAEVDAPGLWLARLEISARP
jgi:putative hydrolase